ncbi:hypothetical protein M0R45_026002 [Rubus argutus]|uniref:Uncharacterized protein n=1 Tax=Rubus argutus TaxID=59490 RepID=A0AAW1WXW8_RUBAR
MPSSSAKYINSSLTAYTAVNKLATITDSPWLLNQADITKIKTQPVFKSWSSLYHPSSPCSHPPPPPTPLPYPLSPVPFASLLIAASCHRSRRSLPP